MCLSRNAPRTSDAIDRLMRSGILRLGFTPQTVLSRTRRGSFPSARTTLSLPAATPLRQCCLACSMDIVVRTTHPLEISFSNRADTVSGSASAAFQFPTHSVSSLGKSACSLGGHCMLRGNSEKAPVGTPSARRGRSLMSGSSDPEASACSNDSLCGWPLSGAMQAGAGACPLNLSLLVIACHRLSSGPFCVSSYKASSRDHCCPRRSDTEAPGYLPMAWMPRRFEVVHTFIEVINYSVG